MTRGRLRVMLGAAPGVGKTFAMLEEGRRLRDAGRDVVVAIVERLRQGGAHHAGTQVDDRCHQFPRARRGVAELAAG